MRWFAVAVGMGVVLSCDPFHTGFEDREPAERYGASEIIEAPDNPTTLKVMNWNVKFGGARLDFFFDCHGTRSLMTESEVLSHMKGVAGLVAAVDPDVLRAKSREVAALYLACGIDPERCRTFHDGLVNEALLILTDQFEVTGLFERRILWWLKLSRRFDQLAVC